MKGRFYLKITSAVIVTSLAVSAFFVPRNEASAKTAGCTIEVITAAVAKGGAFGKILGSVVPVGDTVTQIGATGSFTKDCILTPIAIKMARTMAKNISNSIVNWINTGFKGKPGFANDFGSLVADSADETIGNFIYGSDLKFLCQPFAFKIRLALATKYQQPFQEQVRCSLTDISNNVSSFAKANGGAGWNHWLEITTRPQNNEYGAYLMAESQLASNVQGNLNKINDTLNRNGGFLDFQVCEEWNDPATQAAKANATAFSNAAANAVAGIAGPAQGIANYNAITADQYLIDTSLGTVIPEEKRCNKWVTKTPGSLVADQAKTVLGGWSDQLNLATDIDQIVGALISHFADKMIAGTQGFLGLSSPGGYARSNLDYAKASSLSSDISNPENVGLGDADKAAETGLTNTFAPEETSTGASIASGAPVKESTPGIGSSAWITDGDMSTSAATAESENPWIEIDLGASTSIGDVHIWSPANKSASDAIGTFDIVISNASGNRDWVSDKFTVTDSSPNPTIVTANKTGRFIRVERIDNPLSLPLELAEIGVVPPISATDSDTTGVTGDNTIQLVATSDMPGQIGPSTPYNFDTRLISNYSEGGLTLEVSVIQDGGNGVGFSRFMPPVLMSYSQTNGTMANYYLTSQNNGPAPIVFSNISVAKNRDFIFKISGNGTNTTNRTPLSISLVVKKGQTVVARIMSQSFKPVY